VELKAYCKGGTGMPTTQINRQPTPNVGVESIYSSCSLNYQFSLARIKAYAIIFSDMSVVKLQKPFNENI
jgi:hypothetical protein